MTNDEMDRFGAVLDENTKSLDRSSAAIEKLCEAIDRYSLVIDHWIDGHDLGG